MARLYQYIDKELMVFVYDYNTINTYLNDHGIAIFQEQFIHLDSFKNQKLILDGYDQADIITISTPMTKKDWHCHVTEEARMILKGTGTFYFQVSPIEMMELHVEPSDLVTIPSGVMHHFQTVEPMLVLSFSKTGLACTREV